MNTQVSRCCKHSYCTIQTRNAHGFCNGHAPANYPFSELTRLAKQFDFDVTMEANGVNLLDRLWCMRRMERTDSEREFGLWHDADNMKDAMRSMCWGQKRHDMFAFGFDWRSS